MNLQEKAKYNLANLLRKLVINPDDARVICDDAMDTTDPANIIRFNYADVVMAGVTSFEMWKNIIQDAEEQNLLKQLLEAAKNKNNGNAELSTFYEEITNGFTKRVVKIAKAISRNECVLFIGPGLLQCKTGTSIEAFDKLFAKEISSKLANQSVYFEETLNGSLSYMATRYEDIPNATSRDLGNMAMKSFEKANRYKNVYEKIAQLKFPLIISTNPDDTLVEEYQKQNISISSGFYDRSNTNINLTSYDEDHIIVYNIFGSFQNPYSILFTDNDRVQFSKNVVKNDPPIPPVVKVLLENKYCLFLGFDFEEWHLKILIDCLGLTKTEKEEKTFALLRENANKSSAEHFEKNYKFYFINEEIEKFLDEVIHAIKTFP